jgi:type I restriction-modification system DNA methylase subunit
MKRESFESLLRSFEYRHDLRTVFDDFLTLALCSFSQDPLTGLSHDEELYLQTMEKYKNEELRHNFPKMLACLTHEMEEQLKSDMGNDVLGSFYEQNLYRKGASQYFTPWPICTMMASFTTHADLSYREPLRILDPCCGSGRMLMASAKVNGPDHEYYGIDIDPTCVKMTAINLFLNGMFHSEVMCSDALNPDDFQVSYYTSFMPFGIFRIVEKDRSLLWMLYANSFTRSPQPTNKIVLEDRTGQKTINATQLRLL